MPVDLKATEETQGFAVRSEYSTWAAERVAPGASRLAFGNPRAVLGGRASASTRQTLLDGHERKKQIGDTIN